MQSDNAWKYKDISSTVEKSYFVIQTAWANMDMTPALPYMSDKLFESFQTKLNWMSYRNEKNIMNNIKLLQSLPVSVYDDADNSRDYIWFYIKGKMVDYVIDTNTQMKISGSTAAASFVEYLYLVIKVSAFTLVSPSCVRCMKVSPTRTTLDCALHISESAIKTPINKALIILKFY